MAFPAVEVTIIPQREFEWWRAIAHQTFQRAGYGDAFPRFGEFFDALYEHFATAEPWFLYEDTLTALKYWQSQNIPLGLISNFDSRIHRVLPALGLDRYFTSVTISTEVGAAKPDYKVFETALKKHDCDPANAWHIGDSFREDYKGAKAAGMRAFWLKRKDG